MHDLVLRNARIVDGTGADAFDGDVAVTDGHITEVGRVEGQAREEIRADGRLVSFKPELVTAPYGTPSRKVLQ